MQINIGKWSKSMTIGSLTSTVCIVGAGYVGLPLSDILSNDFKVISFDVDEDKIKTLSSQNSRKNRLFTIDPFMISEADFILICVPTPLSESRTPDMSYIKKAAAIVGRHMKRGSIVILESSVYPGATEEFLKPILEEYSGYQCGIDFHLAYSPERINPGDSVHTIDNTTKIVSADDEDTLQIVIDFYKHITPNIYVAANIQTAEAAKLVENTQRDINLAFINECAMMFRKMGLNTQDVLEAAGSKWNFQKYSPGMVGGYCIPVSPYFLAYRSIECGYNPLMMISSRSINDSVPKHISQMVIESLNETGRVIKGSKVLIMGCSYKENISDIRETPVKGLIKELRVFGIDIYGYDPLINDGERQLGINIIESLEVSPKIDCVIVTLNHDVFKDILPEALLSILNPSPVIIDLRGLYDMPEIRNSEVIYRRF